MQKNNKFLEKKKEKQNKKTNAYKKKHRRKSKNKNKKRENIIRSIANERIDYLMNRAIEIYSLNPDLANRYVEIARKYSMSLKVNIPQNFKKLICHNCKKLMIPGVSSRNRIQSRKKRGSRYVITCLNCNHKIHIYYKRKDGNEQDNNQNNILNTSLEVEK
ncbi:MAG: hypothetical protein GY870_03795 [archaeon]|nr:hypothetical protein [archaeon]